MLSDGVASAAHRWQVGYAGGPYGGVAWLQLDNGILSLEPFVIPYGSGVPRSPAIPQSERPLVHEGETVDVVHARWSMNGSVHVRGAVRTYVAVLSSWRPIARDIIPALEDAGLDVVVHRTRLG